MGWNRIQKPEINPLKYSYLILHKGGKKKNFSSKNSIRKIEYFVGFFAN
jgi:hypothetical protein